MVRTVGSYGPKTVKAIRQAALRLIYEQGFEAMNLRDLAKQVGILPGSLYNHIRTKQGLLFDLMKAHLENLLRSVDEELDGVEDPVDRMRIFVGFHANYYMTKKREVFIANSELRSLVPKNHTVIIHLRSEYLSRVVQILEQGIEKGVFDVSDTHITAYAILAMLRGICNWYSPAGRLSKQEISDIYIKLVLGALIPGMQSRTPILSQK